MSVNVFESDPLKGLGSDAAQTSDTVVVNCGAAVKYTRLS